MRTLLVDQGATQFRLTIPDEARVTFGPWSPPSSKRGYGGGHEYNATGTLRIYAPGKENILACYSGVTGFQDLALKVEKKIATEEGATIWKSDQHGYVREEKVERKQEWVRELPPAKATKKKASR